MMRHGDWFFGGRTELSMTQFAFETRIFSLSRSAAVNMQGHQKERETRKRGGGDSKEFRKLRESYKKVTKVMRKLRRD